jgi:hypothetical protein
MDKQRMMHIIEGLDWDKLNEWEEEFVQSCELRLGMMGDITPRQEEVLEKIFRRKAR